MKKNLIKNNNKRKTVQEGNLKNAALLGAGLTAGAIGGAKYPDKVNNAVDTTIEYGKKALRPFADGFDRQYDLNHMSGAERDVYDYCEKHGLDYFNEDDRMQAEEAVANSNGEYNFWDTRFDESRRYKTVRLTESELHHLIKRSVSQILKEYKKY